MAETYAYLATADEIGNKTGIYFDEKAKSVRFPKFALEPGNIDEVMKLTVSYSINSSVISHSFYRLFTRCCVS